MALTGRQILDSITPAIEVCGVEIQSTGTNNTGVSILVELLVHDVIENTQISEYLSAGVFDKYIKVKVNASSTTQTGALLIQPEQLTSQLARRSRTNSKYFAESHRLHELFTDKNLYEKKVLESGKVVKSFKFKKEYRFESGCPATFSLYAQSVIDTDGLEDELGIPTDSFTQNLAKSQAKAERFDLFRDKELVSKKISYVYYENNSSSGGLARTPVEYMGEVAPIMSPYNVRTGRQIIGWTPADDSGRELEQIEENFTNVQDFRIRFSTGTSVARAYGYTESQIRSDIESIYSTLNNLERESLKKQTDSLHQQSSISSDLWLTKGSSGVVNFIFCLDLNSLLQKNSDYKQYYGNFSNQLLREIMSKVQVTSLCIKRERVSIFKTPSAPHITSYKDDNYAKEYVIETSKNSNQAFKNTRSQTGAIKELLILENSGLTFLTGTDYEISKISQGNYSYGYEMKIIDPTRDVLIEKIKQLEPLLSGLKEVYSKLSMPGYNRYSDSSTDLSSDISHPDVYRIGNRTMGLQEFIGHSLQEYKKVVELFNTGFEVPASFYLGAAYAALATPFGISKMIKLFETFIMRISEILRITSSELLSDSFRSNPKRNLPNKSIPKVIEFSRYYRQLDKIIDASLPKGNGINYLENPEVEFDELESLARETSQVGLRVISGTQWEQRQSAELSRYFIQVPETISLPTQNSQSAPLSLFSMSSGGSEILSPSVFHINGRAVNNAIDNETIAEKITEIAIPSIPEPGGFNPPPPPPPPSVETASSDSQPALPNFFRANVATNLFSNFNVTFQDTELLSASRLSREVTESLEAAFDSCIFVRSNPIDPHTGWQDSDSGIVATAEVDEQGAVLSNSEIRSAEQDINIGVNLLSYMRTSLLSTRALASPLPTPHTTIQQNHQNGEFSTLSPTSGFNVGSNFSSSIVGRLPAQERLNFISSLPIQLKALLLSTVEGEEGSVVESVSIGASSLNTGTEVVSLGFLASIEYFSGFEEKATQTIIEYGQRETTSHTIVLENATPSSNLGHPVWNPLTAEAFAANKGKRLMCRIKKTHYEDLGIRESSFGTPIYDSYFIIEPPRNFATSEGYSVESERVRRQELEETQRRRRLNEATELEKARLLSRIRRLRDENEEIRTQQEREMQRAEEYTEDNQKIWMSSENWIDPIPNRGFNWKGALNHPWQNVSFYLDIEKNPVEISMVPFIYEEFLMNWNFIQQLVESHSRMERRIGENNIIIAGYQNAITASTEYDIDTAEEVDAAYSEHQYEIREIRNQIRNQESNEDFASRAMQEMIHQIEYWSDAGWENSNRFQDGTWQMHYLTRRGQDVYQSYRQLRDDSRSEVARLYEVLDQAMHELRQGDYLD